MREGTYQARVTVSNYGSSYPLPAGALRDHDYLNPLREGVLAQRIRIVCVRRCKCPWSFVEIREAACRTHAADPLRPSGDWSGDSIWQKQLVNFSRID